MPPLKLTGNPFTQEELTGKTKLTAGGGSIVISVVASLLQLPLL
jgi:hypothetical protein